MAKKTKKQKIIADQRRKLQTPREQNAPSDISEKSQVISNTEGISPLTSHLSPPPQTQSLYIYPVHLIKKDLTKTILLSILAISLEIALFFILEKNLSLPFKFGK